MKTCQKDNEVSWRVPTGQIWDNLSIQRNNEVTNYNPPNIIGIHESTQIQMNKRIKERTNEWTG